MRIRDLILLLGFLASFSVSYTPVAHAQEQGYSKSQAYLLNGPTPYITGENQITYYFALLNKDGSPYTGFKGEVSLSSGDKGKLEELERGLYSFAVLPAVIQKRKTIRVSIKGNGQGGKISQGWNVLWLPQATGSLTLRSDTKNLMLTKDATAELDIKFKGT